VNALARVVASPVLIRPCRIALGLVLLAAALAKIGDPAALATQIRHYHMMPAGPENLLAITLPWIELLAGLALVLRFHARPGAWLAVAMMVVFTFAVAQAMARGLNFECGCFGAGDATRVGVKKLLENLALTAVAMVGVRRM
jgi:putative oxidoreductase